MTPAELEAARQQLLATIILMLEAVYEPSAVPVLATLHPADMLPGGARVPGTSYELPAATAARTMSALLALRGGSADTLLQQLAAADITARLAAIKGQHPPMLASLYPWCVPQPVPAGTLIETLSRLYLAATQVLTATQLRRIDQQCQEWTRDPASIDRTPVQQFVARFVRNAP
jgi:hypothetical protein